jgi:hypothetical protein
MITEKRKEELIALLAAFPFGMLQDFVTFSLHCERENIKLHEVIGYIESQIKDEFIAAERAYNRQQAVKKIVAEKFPYCPVCKNQLRLEAINNHPGRVIDDHSKSWWICPDPECEYEPVLSDEHPQKVLSDMGIVMDRTNKQLNPQSRAKRARAAGRQRGCGQRG